MLDLRLRGHGFKPHWRHCLVVLEQDTFYPPIGLDKQKKISVKLLIFSYPYFLSYVLGAQKNRLIETVLLSTHNICFG